ncbi:MAG: hypothetical protein Kow0062_28410 [Acidobacteriota bacterium]
MLDDGIAQSVAVPDRQVLRPPVAVMHQIARARLTHPELLRRFEKGAQLPEEKTNAVLLLLDAVVAKHTIKKIMGS